VWYLIIMTVLSVAQHYIERYFSRGAVRNPAPLPFQALFQRFRRPLPVLDSTTDKVRNLGFHDARALRAGGAVRIHGISKSFGL
ncbi:ABC transporter ATP-binding protein, partial [Pseudomonas sp. BGM005]|nr:ABC transporter ATP-binding protein [Pseudomonas sp. BG5]